MTLEKNPNNTWIPSTPAGTVLAHLEAPTQDEAWENLLKDAAHMPYEGRSGFADRGYTVNEYATTETVNSDHE